MQDKVRYPHTAKAEAQSLGALDAKRPFSSYLYYLAASIKRLDSSTGVVEASYIVRCRYEPELFHVP